MLVPANLALRFVLELAALAAVAWCGWELGGSTAARLALAVVFPLAVAFVWGTFIAPKARVKVSRPVWLALQIGIFVVAAIALAVGLVALGRHRAAARLRRESRRCC